MNIEKLIKENYEIAKSKGFYPDDSKIEGHLMGIVSEIGEAYEAHRQGKFCNPVWFESSLRMLSDKPGFMFSEWYKDRISGTFEDELADIFIRLFNLYGWLRKELKLKTGDFYNIGWTNISGDLLMIQRQIVEQRDYSFGLSLLYGFCNHHKIDIESHIQAKMEYNKTREHLHGKAY